MQLESSGVDLARKQHHQHGDSRRENAGVPESAVSLTNTHSNDTLQSELTNVSPEHTYGTKIHTASSADMRNPMTPPLIVTPPLTSAT